MSQVVLATSRLEISPPQIPKNTPGSRYTVQSHDTHPLWQRLVRAKNCHGAQNTSSSLQYECLSWLLPSPTFLLCLPLPPPPPSFSQGLQGQQKRVSAEGRELYGCSVDTKGLRHSSSESVVVSGALIKYLQATLSRGQAVMTPGPEYVWSLFPSHATTSLSSSMHSLRSCLFPYFQTPC